MKEVNEIEAQYRKMTETPVCICGNMLFFHLKGIEWSQPVADVLSAAISLPFIWKILQQLNVSTDDKSSVQ